MEFGPYVNYAVAAAIVLALLLIAMFVLRAVGGRVRARQGSRLSISEYQEVDKQRHLVLVRRDGVEHLLMIGGPQDVVIETGIVSSGVAAPAPQFDPGRLPPVHELRQAPVMARAEPEEPRPVPLRAAPRPAVFGDRPPEPVRQQQRAEPRLEPVKRAEESTPEE
ncbi:MAG: hypothetical protein AB7S41_00935 [Parvibaculaceae bacterium]